MKPIISKLIKNLQAASRLQIVFYIFCLAAFYVIFTTAKYTLLEWSYWKSLAEGQQIREIKETINRGSIFSDNEPAGIFATSAQIYDIAIDPQQTGSKQRLLEFLSNITYQQLCEEKTPNTCYDKMLSFLGIYELPDFNTSTTYLKEKISKEVGERMSKQYITNVHLKEKVSEEQKQRIIGLNNPGLFFYVDNL